MMLDENLFEEVKKGDVRGLYKKKELSDQEILDKVFDKLQAKLISKHYKVGTDSNNLFINARVVNKKLPNGRVVIKKEFLTDKKDYEDIIKYLDEANVKHEFKDSIQGLQLNILLDKDNAKEVNQDVLNRNVRAKKENFSENLQYLSKEEIESGKDRWVKTEEDQKVWDSLSDEDKEFLTLCIDMGFWFDEVQGNEELEDRYEELKSKFSLSLKESLFTVELYKNPPKDPEERVRFDSYKKAMEFAKTKTDGSVEEIYITKAGINGPSILNHWHNKWYTDLDETYKIVNSEGKKVPQGGGFKSKEEAEMFAAQYGEKDLRVLRETYVTIKSADEIDDKLKEFKKNIDNSINAELPNTRYDLDPMEMNLPNNDKIAIGLTKDNLFTVSITKNNKESIQKFKTLKGARNYIFNEFPTIDTITNKLNKESAKENPDKFIKAEESLKEELSPEQEKEYGLTTLINALIKDELEAIDGYNSAIVTLEAENKGEFTDVIRDIIGEENTHIGQLQAILKELNPSTTADIDEGQKEGQEQIDQAVGMAKGDTEETTTTIDTEEGVIKTYKLNNMEKMEEK